MREDNKNATRTSVILEIVCASELRGLNNVKVESAVW